jgi:putative sterol carrier protein
MSETGENAMSKVQYISSEWAVEAQERLRKELTPEKMKHLTSSMVTVYRSCPDGKRHAVYYGISEGVVAEVSVWEESWPEAEFVITGDYETLAQISKAELKSRKALMTGKLKLEGNLVKALSLAVVVDRLNEVLADIPTEY